MAYIDILSQENYINVNTKAIQLFGRDTALYLSVLLNAYSRVRDKQTYDEEGFWTLKRSYVTDKTTLTPEEQKECDDILSKAGIVERSATSKLRVNAAQLTTVLTSEDTAMLKTIAATTKATTKAEKAKAKKEGIQTTMKKICNDLTADEDLQNALGSWVESVYANKRFLTKDVINTFWQQITDYTKDKSKQLDFIKTAMVHGWVDASWVINKEPKQRASLTNTVDMNAPIKY